MGNPTPILLIANFSARLGGGEESLLALLRGMDRRRFLPHVVVPGEGEMADVLRNMGIFVTILFLPTVRPWTFLSVVKAIQRLRDLIIDGGIMVVHAQGTRGALYANLAGIRLHIPVMWHVRVVDRDPWLDGILFRLSSAVVANSQATADRFTGRSGASKKLHVIHNGVDLDRFRPGLPENELRRGLGLPLEGPVITFAGRLEYVKGPDLFLEAAIRVHEDLPQVHFLFSGEGPMRSELESRAKSTGIPAVFIGNQQDMLPVYNLSTLVVVPSRQEAFGRVLIEAMATDTPIVATKVGGIPEVCRDGRTAILVDPENPAALASAMMETLTDVKTAGLRVRAAGKDVRERFSLDHHVERVSQLYATFLSNGHASRGNS